MKQRLNRFLHKCRLVKDHCGLQLLGDVEEMVDHVADTIDYLDRVRIVVLLHDGQVDRSLPVYPNQVVLNLVRIFSLAEIVNRYPRRSHSFHRNLAELIHVVDETVGVDVVIQWSHLDVARRQYEIGTIDRTDNIHGAKLPGCQLVGIYIDHDLAVFPAKGRRNLGSLYDGNLIADSELSNIMKLSLVQTLTLKRHQTNWETGGIELQHNRGKGAGWQ